MFSDLLSDTALTAYAVVGLVMFVLVFVGTAIWILTRPKRQVDGWARLPLAADDDCPLDDRSFDSQSPSGPSGPSHPSATTSRA